MNVNVGAEWDTWFVPGLTVTGRVIYTSGQFVNAANTLSIPEWTRLDLGARYTFTSPWNGKPIMVRFAVENVFNRLLLELLLRLRRCRVGGSPAHIPGVEHVQLLSAPNCERAHRILKRTGTPSGCIFRRPAARPRRRRERLRPPDHLERLAVERGEPELVTMRLDITRPLRSRLNATARCHDRSRASAG